MILLIAFLVAVFGGDLDIAFLLFVHWCVSQ